MAVKTWSILLLVFVALCIGACVLANPGLIWGHAVRPDVVEFEECVIKDSVLTCTIESIMESGTKVTDYELERKDDEIFVYLKAVPYSLFSRREKWQYPEIKVPMVEHLQRVVLTDGRQEKEIWSRYTHFRATVDSLSEMGQFNGESVPVDENPEFVLTLELLDPVAALNKNEAEVVHFAIHSPAVLFGEENIIKKTYSFELAQDIGGDFSLEHIESTGQ